MYRESQRLLTTFTTVTNDRWQGSIAVTQDCVVPKVNGREIIAKLSPSVNQADIQYRITVITTTRRSTEGSEGQLVKRFQILLQRLSGRCRNIPDLSAQTQWRLASIFTNFFCRMTGLAGWKVSGMLTVAYGLTRPSTSGHENSSPSASRPTSRHVTGSAAGFFIVNDWVSRLQHNHTTMLINAVC